MILSPYTVFADHRRGARRIPHREHTRMEIFMEEHFTEPYINVGDSDGSEGPDTPYVSFVKTMSTGKRLYIRATTVHLCSRHLARQIF